MRSIDITIGGAASLLVAAAATAVGTCGDWGVVPNPTFEGTELLPRFITPLGLNSAVGLGSIQDTQIIRMTWDGTAWTTMDTGPIGIVADMRGAVILAPDDIWICGITSADNHGRPHLAHWDGQSWDATVGTVIDNPFPNGGDPLRNAEASDLAVIAPDDIWCIGAGNAAGVGGNFVACHWDGSSLEEVALQPNIYDRINQVQDVDAAATDDVWAVGYGRNSLEYFHAAMYHYDGTSWTPMEQWTPLPGQDVVTETLWDVATPARDDAWAVGDKTVQVGLDTFTESLYLHWNGTSWTEVAGPNIGPLTSIADNGPDDVWVACGFGEYGGRLAHWDGASWTEVPSAPFPGATHIGINVQASADGCNVWATGYWAIYDGAGGWEQFNNIVEHLSATAACPSDSTGDGLVNVDDLLRVLAMWGTADTGADASGDGTVNVTDLLMVLSDWGVCG